MQYRTRFVLLFCFRICLFNVFLLNEMLFQLTYVYVEYFFVNELLFQLTYVYVEYIFVYELLFQLTYALVVFLSETDYENEEIGIICTKWMRGRSFCLWPNSKGRNVISRFLQIQADPQPDWQTYPIRVLFSDIGKQPTILF